LVRVALPPPATPPNPVFHRLPAGTDLFRLFNPARHATTATSFRYFGPLLRFDHHRSTPGMPGPDMERGVYYASLTLSCCIVEIFGDTGLIDCGNWHIAMPFLSRDVRLLDLRGNGAMRAGSVAALGKVPDHSISQHWSNWFYEQMEYRQPEGLHWYNAHNDEESLMFYERAEDALVCPPDRIIRLDDPSFRPDLLRIATDNNLILVP
jgi:hypothetical protein